MRSLRDEIRLSSGERTDLISSAEQISSERSEDLIALGAISLTNTGKSDMVITQDTIGPIAAAKEDME